MTVYLRTVNFFRSVKYPEASRIYFIRSREDFEKLINSFEYKADPLRGLCDYVAHPDKFFDRDRKEGRDCDDWARIWSLWGTYHNYRAREYVVCNPSSIKKAFSTMHVITVLQNKATGKWFLANYHWYGPFKTEEEALDYLKNWSSYGDNKLVVFSREIPADPDPLPID